MGSRLLVALLGPAIVVVGCGDPERQPCVERDGASPELPRVSLSVRSGEISAEVADSEQERQTAWAERRCDLDALLWVPDEVGPVSVSLCEVVVAVDLAFLRDGRVVTMERDRAPCRTSCEDCPAYSGDPGSEFDAVLWLLAGEIEIEVGDEVVGLEAVDLPTAGSSTSADR
ncbi:MAG: DUF192 domain-containing protein [Myxococcota bacterium]